MFNQNIYPQIDILYKIRFNPDLWNIEGVILAWLLNAVLVDKKHAEVIIEKF